MSNEESTEEEFQEHLDELALSVTAHQDSLQEHLDELALSVTAHQDSSSDPAVAVVAETIALWRPAQQPCSPPLDGDDSENPGVDGEGSAWVEPESASACHYLTPVSSVWEYIWPNLRSYPNPTPLPGVRLEDPETYPFQSRVYEFGEYDQRRGLRTNVYPECCCFCDELLDYYVPWGVCGTCLGRFLKALLGRFSEAAWVITKFLEPVPAYQCPKCENGWPGWYCFNCGCETPGFILSASPQWKEQHRSFGLFVLSDSGKSASWGATS